MNRTVILSSKCFKKAEQEIELESAQIAELSALVSEFRDCFADKPGRSSLVEHDIQLTNDIPIRSRPHLVSAKQREILAREIKRTLEIAAIVSIGNEYT